MNKVWNASAPEVPVDEDGNWLNYPSYRYDGWLKVTPFWGTMKIDGMRTGRSSKIVILENVETGTTYPMFVADLIKGLMDGSMIVNGGHINGMWTASKRGQNYGIKLVKDFLKSDGKGIQ